MSPDIAGMMSGQTEVVLAAYEDRIAQLRVEVDRLHSRNYARTGDINLQLQELAQQQEVLSEQHQFVRLLADKATELGIETELAAGDADGGQPMVTGALPPVLTPADDIARAGLQMQQMMIETRMALAAISDAAAESTEDILASLKTIGIKPELPAASEAMGGPFLPPEDGPDAASLVDDANAVMEALSRFKAAKDAIDPAPIHTPLAGSLRISSSYGNRRDPFSGGKAFHAGIDFPAPRGTSVLAAGEGTVTFAGQMSGYGNMVEITHGAGLVTRYAHLSSFLVKEGQTVKTGTPIAKVGSTGRSTGPHLHFEVRRDDRAIDPGKFLAAGKALQRFLA
jgi:murein DD-endopeptidase MepM/ murein hydrolase activator NlpD